MLHQTLHFWHCVCTETDLIQHRRNSDTERLTPDPRTKADLGGQVDLHGGVGGPVAHGQNVHRQLDVGGATLVLGVLPGGMREATLLI